MRDPATVSRHLPPRSAVATPKPTPSRQVTTEGGELSIKLAAACLSCGLGDGLKIDCGTAARADALRDGIAVACHEVSLVPQNGHWSCPYSPRAVRPARACGLAAVCGRWRRHPATARVVVGGGRAPSY